MLLVEKMDDLPVEVKTMILKQVNIEDLLSCRLVSKKFKAYIDNIKPTELIVEKKNRGLKDGINWYNSTELINFKNRMFITNISSIESSPFNLTNLRNLKIDHFASSHSFDLTILNQFDKLERLEIEKVVLNTTKNDGDILLTFPNLRSLVILIESDSTRKLLIIDAVKLETYKCGFHLRSVKLLHPTSVKHLAADLFYKEDLECFKAVEYLALNCVFSRLPENIFEQLQKLKEIHYNYHGIYVDHDYQNLEPNMDSLIAQRKWSNKQHVRIFYDEYEMIGNTKFRKYGFYTDFRMDERDLDYYSDDSDFDY